MRTNICVENVILRVALGTVMQAGIYVPNYN